MSPIKRTLAVLLLLAFTGQAVVSVAAPCFMMNAPTGEMNHDMADMDHGGHAGHDMSAEQDSASSCCDGGLCSMSHCQMAPAMPIPLFDNSPEKAFTYSAIDSVSAVISSLTTLYRPPIIA
jgi:uncharacterized protein involved in copper resistance